MQVELAESQQQLEELTSRLHSTQLQHQAKIADLQRQHELRVMQLFKQPSTAKQVESSDQHQVDCNPKPRASATVKPELLGDASAAAVLLADSHVHNLRPPQQRDVKSIAATVAAVFQGSVDAAALKHTACSSVTDAGQGANIMGIPDADHHHSSCHTVVATAEAKPAAHSIRETTSQPAAACITSTGGSHSSLPQDDHVLCSARCPTATNLAAWVTAAQANIATSQQLQAVNPFARTPTEAVTGVAEQAQHRLAPKKVLPAGRPQLSDLISCLAGKSLVQQQACEHHPQQLMAAGHQPNGRMQQKLDGMEAASQGDLQNVHLLNSSCSNNSRSTPTPGSPAADQQLFAGGDSSPSKLQARLAAYRSHLKQASPQKERSASVNSQAGAGQAAHITAAATAYSAVPGSNDSSGSTSGKCSGL